MEIPEAREATPIVQFTMFCLLDCVPPAGRAGSDARTAIGDIIANAYIMLRTDALGQPLADAFAATQLAGATVDQIRNNVMYRVAGMKVPATVGAIVTFNSIIALCLATMAQIIVGMTFESRQDVDLVKQQMALDFAPAEEAAADNMDSPAYELLISLHASVTNHLVTTARPLPQVLRYEFHDILSTLVIAHKLYSDPSRADEIRAENKIVHPAFCPHNGIALSG